MEDYQFTITRMDGIMLVTMSDDGYPLICLKFGDASPWWDAPNGAIFRHVYQVYQKHG